MEGSGQAPRATSETAALLVIGAVDCIADFLLCNEVGIESFPTIKMFGEGFPVGTAAPAAATVAIVVETTVALLEAAPREVLEAAVSAAGGSSSGAEVVAVTSLSSRAQCRDETTTTAAVNGTGLRPGEAPKESRFRPQPLADAASAVLYGVQRELLRVPLGARGSGRRDALGRGWLCWPIAFRRGEPRVAAAAQLARRGGARSPSTRRGGSGWWRRGRRAGCCRGDGHGRYRVASVPRLVGRRARVPCGLWSLFPHAARAARAAERRRRAGRHPGYVRYFLAARNAPRTLHLADAPGDPMLGGRRRRRFGAAALWLWRAHNSVNARLNRSGEAAVLELGRAEAPVPETAEECPACRAVSGKWREASFLRHLGLTYCHDEVGAACAAPPPAARGVEVVVATPGECRRRVTTTTTTTTTTTMTTRSLGDRAAAAWEAACRPVSEVAAAAALT